MRVLQVHNRALTSGGADTVVEHDRTLLEATGHVVDQFFVESADTLAGVSRARAGAKAIWNVEVARELRARIGAFAPDVVHVHTPFPLASPVVFRVAAASPAATVATVHSYRYSCINGLFFRDGAPCEVCAGRAIKLAGMRHRCYHDSFFASTALTTSLSLHRAIGTFATVDVWIALSDFMRETLVREGIDPGRVLSKAQTAPDPAITRSGAGEHMLFAGRFEPGKGVEVLLDAWRLLDDAPPLVIAGDGSLRGLVEDAAASNDRISYVGWLETDELVQMLASARYLVFPSEFYEGAFPVSIVQSLAIGTPVIVSDSLATADEAVGHGGHGRLFCSGSADSLASVIADAWADVDAQRRASHAARAAYLQDHAEDGAAAALLAAYDRATGRDSTAAESLVYA